jgi:hypothetical protein
MGKSQKFVSALSRLALARGTRPGELIRKICNVATVTARPGELLLAWRVQQDQHHLFLLLKLILSIGKLSLTSYHSFCFGVDRSFPITLA